MKKLFIIFCLLIFSVSAYAECTKEGTTITCPLQADCTSASLQTQLNAASAGDTVVCTYEGTITWNSQINISGGKTLSGGGSKTGDANSTTGTWNVVVNITHNSTAAIAITNANTQSVNRVTGFKFQGSGGPTYIISVAGTGTGTTGYGSFRIDNNYFNEPTYTTRVIRTDGSTGQMNGLVDHNVFYYKSTSSLPYGNIAYANNAHAGLNTCYGYDSWVRATGFGTSDFVFYEDNYFLNSGIETSEGGGRLVSRYNYYTTDYNVGISGLDGHGADTGGNYCIGIVANEFYNNTLTGSGIAHAVNMRGGKWMVHNNTINNGAIQIDEYRLRSAGSLDWKLCSGTFCCPKVPAQCDVQQPTISDFEACYPVLNQVSDTYLWSNSVNPTVAGANATITYYIAENRDYWIASTGLAANIPGICTTGAGYWATDTSTLYKCASTNTWEASYTPYTYPHPLRGESDTTAPTNTSNSINADGDELTTGASESINKTGDGAVTLTCSGGAVTATYSSGTGTATWKYALNRTILQAEVCTLDYTQGGNDIEDIAGNDMATFTGHAVVNGSTEQSETTYELAVTVVGGGTVNSSQGGIGCTAANSPCSKTCDSGTVLTMTPVQNNGWNTGSWSGTGCGASITMSAARTCTYTFTEIKLMPW